MRLIMERQHTKLEKQKIDSITSPKLKEILACRTIYKEINYKKLEASLSKLDVFGPYVTSPEYKALLEKEINNLKALIESKMPDHVQINKNPDSDGEKLLQEIIAQHPGKVLYIDFWATWCGPCISSFKAVKPIKNTFADQDVIFVYLCGSNSNRKSYETLLKVNDVKGEHYYLSEKQWKTLWKKFKIKGIPHFVLINKKGQVENSNAPSPFEGRKLSEDIKKLLNQR